MQQQQQQEGLLALKLHNPFSLRVGQVFTGFGVGCGIGIGLGRPINLSHVPGLSDVASAGSSSLGGVRHHLQNLGKKLGIKNVQAGVGCGVGLGHGFGIGVTLKPGVVQQLKHLVEQGLSAVTKRMQTAVRSSNAEGEGNDNTIEKRMLDEGNTLSDTFFSKSKTSEKLLGDFLHSSPTAATKAQQAQDSMHGEVDRLQTENRILLTLLTHQEQIDVLKKENAALKQALAEERESAKPVADEVEHRIEGRKSRTECFECRRRGWQRR